MQMAQAAQEKGRGLKFAEQQLLRHGWEHGKGLGRAENGISEAIKVKVKCDKGGVGHKEGEQFTFHWWDHVFNKASSSLQVESDQKGIALKKTTEEAEEEDGISNKKPRKASLAKAKLYGCFVKSATLLSGHEQPEPKSSNSEDSSSSEEEDDDQTLDLSSTTKLSDAALMKACGGRTAHKGARHGLTMSAKLARLEQQEAEFMAKYGKKSQPASASLACVTSAPSAEPREERQEGVAEDTGSKKVKKKTFTGSRNELSGVEASQSAETQIKPKKKKKKKRDDGEAEKVTEAVSMEEEEDGTCVDNSETDHSHKTTRKHKKKRNKAEPREDDGPPATEINGLEPKAETHTDTKGKKKKKKKSSKRRSEEEESNNTEASQSEQRDAADSCTEEKQEEATVKQKRKKCKKDKLSIDEQEDEEALLPKRKKKKSKD